MSQLEVTEEQRRYNEIAIEYAAKIQRVRSTSKATSQLVVDDLLSIAFKDNRAAQHYAARDYYPHQRLLRRVTVSGDGPHYNPVNE